MHQFSDEALARADSTVKAAEVLRANAASIAAVAANIKNSEVIVAVVKRDLTLGGIHVLQREKLAEEIKAVEEEGGWSLTFSAHLSIAQVEQRCTEWQQQASRRGEMMHERVERQSLSSSKE